MLDLSNCLCKYFMQTVSTSTILTATATVIKLIWNLFIFHSISGGLIAKSWPTCDPVNCSPRISSVCSMTIECHSIRGIFKFFPQLLQKIYNLQLFLLRVSRKETLSLSPVYVGMFPQL